MNNLLSANFTRLRKSRTFLASVIFMVTYVAAVLIYVQIQVSLGSEIAFDTLFLNGYGLGGFIAFPGLLLSVVCGIFIGTDFSDGTLRNKIVAYASFYNMLTMLLKDKTTAVVAGMVITLVSMFLSFYLMMRTFEPEFITITSLTDSNISEKVVPNKKYLSGSAVKIVQFIESFQS